VRLLLRRELTKLCGAVPVPIGLVANWFAARWSQAPVCFQRGVLGGVEWRS
jgi:hypothetical protein